MKGVKKMNRIQKAIERTNEKLLTIPEWKKKDLEEKLDINEMEFVAYQNAKSKAQMESRINLDEALTIYNILNKYDTSTLAEKIVISRTMAELMYR